MPGFQNATAGQDGLRNIVRYDTPTFAGFVGSASWGEDDMWELALNYRGEVGDFKLAGSLGYGESSDQTLGTGNNVSLADSALPPIRLVNASGGVQAQSCSTCRRASSSTAATAPTRSTSPPA